MSEIVTLDIFCHRRKLPKRKEMDLFSRFWAFFSNSVVAYIYFPFGMQIAFIKVTTETVKRHQRHADTIHRQKGGEQRERAVR